MKMFVKKGVRNLSPENRPAAFLHVEHDRRGAQGRENSAAPWSRDIVVCMKRVNIKTSLVSFALGLAIMLGISMVKPEHSQAQAPAHVFEMRTYYAMPGKMDDLKTRFRDHTITIFNRHHMKSIGYWEPQDNKENTLVYMLEHASKEDGLKNWAEFSADPEWKQVAKASEANGKLVDHVVRVWMNPTDFSAIK